MTRTRSPRRAGFTLIELLVVISIIALLAAIAASAVVRVRASQQAKSNDMTVDKVQKALEQQWKAVVDECKATNGTTRRMPQGLITYCEGDEKRAMALWIYMQLRNEFPQSTLEAKSGVGGYLAPKKTFSQVGTSSNPEDEAAALLYLILTEKASGGANSLTEDVISATIATPAGTAFRDAYGTPITFRRFFSGHSELGGAPFINPRSTSKDPIDVDLALKNWSTPIGKTTNTYRQQAAGWVGLSDFNNTNVVISVFSAGPNGNKVNGGPYWDLNHPDQLVDGDNFVGYRLRRMGNKGD
jgi:prepilin-type N-terminal cleavage/methylation domain-containing protein